MATTDKHTIEMGASMETEEGLAIIDALNEVSDVLAMAGQEVTFIGDGPYELGAFDRLRGIDLYACPRGAFLFFREPQGASWAVAGPTPESALEQIHEDALREHVRHALHRHALL